MPPAPSTKVCSAPAPPAYASVATCAPAKSGAAEISKRASESSPAPPAGPAPASTGSFHTTRRYGAGKPPEERERSAGAPGYARSSRPSETVAHSLAPTAVTARTRAKCTTPLSASLISVDSAPRAAPALSGL